MSKIYHSLGFMLLAFILSGQCPIQNPINLPYFEGFEDASGSTLVNTDPAHCDANGSWAFETTAQNGGRLAFQLGYSRTGSNAATLDRDIGFQLLTNFLTGTLDLSNYDTAGASHLVLDFYHLDHGDEVNPNDKVWVRGDTSHSWIEIYDLDAHGVNGSYIHAQNLNLTNILKTANQNFSSQFQIRFGQEGYRRASSLTGLDGRSFDDIRIVEEACPSVGQVSYAPTNATSGSLHFDGPGSFEIEYGPCGFVQGNGTTLSGSAPINLSGLSPQTCYDVYVRRDCQSNSNGFSAWSGPHSFTTACTPKVAPYLETFDGAGWSPSPNSNGSGDALNSCWSRNPAPGAYSWVVRSGPTPTTGTGPTGDHTTGSGNYLATETDNAPYFIDAELYSPMVDISGLTVPQVSFYYHLFGDSRIDTIFVDVWSNGVWHNEMLALGDEVAASSSPFLKATLHLSGFADTVQLRFRIFNTLGGNKRDAAIDDVSFEEGMSCPKPLSVSASQLTDTSALLNWSSPVAGQWIVLYDTAGFDPATEGIVDTVSSLPFSLEHLAPGVPYDVYVIADCSPAGFSDTSDVYSFWTLCPAAIEAPYFNSFELEENRTPPVCWTLESTLSISFYEVIANIIPAATGTQSLYFSARLSHSRSDTVMLISPPLGGLAMNNKRIKFKIRGYAGSDIVVVSLPSPNSSSGFTPLDTFTISQTFVYEEFTSYLNSSNGHNLTDQYIGLKFETNPSTSLQVDDFWFEEGPLCADADNIQLQAFTDTSASFGFSSQEDSIQYEYGPRGFTLGSGVPVTQTGSSFTIDNLAPGGAYELYVQSLCTLDSSNWQGPVPFRTFCADPNPITLPYAEDFESLSVDTFNLPGGIKCDSVSSLELHKAIGYGEGRGFINTDPADVHSGSQAFTMDAGSSAGLPLSYLSLRLNMSNYSAPNAFPIELSFYHMSKNVVANDSDRVFIRGADTAAWIDVFNIHAQSPGHPGTYRKVNNIFVDSILAQHGQVFTESFEIRFGERSRSEVLLPGVNDGRTFDDILLTEVRCEGASDLKAYFVDNDSAGIRWSSDAPAFEIEYGPRGYVPGNGTAVFTTDTFAIISGLSAATSYDIYVKDSCANGFSSAHIGPIKIQTDCDPLAPLTLPFHEGFESLSGTHLESALFCDSVHNWRFQGEYFNSRLHFNTDPASVKSGSTAAAMDLKTFAGVYANYLTLSVNLLNYAGTQRINLSFSYMQDNQGNHPENRVWIRSSDSAAWIEIYDLDANKTTSGVYKDVQDIDIAAPLVTNGQALTDEVQIRFGQQGTAPIASPLNPDGFIFDDIMLEQVACGFPIDLHVQNLSDTSATMAWHVPLGNSGHTDVWLGREGFFQGVGSTSSGIKVMAGQISWDVDTLSPNTCYEFLVRYLCLNGDTSVWVGPYKFCTLCSSFTTPYTENFDDVNLPALPQCWNEIDNGNDDLFSVISTDHGAAIPSFPNAIELNDGILGGANPDTAMLITPSFADLPSGMNQIRFKAAIENTASGGELIIGTMAHPHDASSWTPYDTLLSSQLSTVFNEHVITMDNLSLIGNNTYITFVHGSFTSEIYLDDFVYEAVPNCQRPSSLQASAVGSYSAQLNWSSPNGGSSSYEIEYGIGLATPGNGTRILASGTGHTLSGLSATTSYCFFVREICAPGDTSTWSGPECFRTTCGDIIAPHFEDFEGVGLGSGLVFDNCWESSSTGSPNWVVQISDGTDKNTAATGPLHDHTFQGLLPGRYIFLESNIANDSASLMTPWMDISSLAQPEISYWYYMYGAGIGALNTWVDTGSGYFKVQSITGQQQSSQSDPWLQATVPLPAADSLRIKFTGIVGSTSPWVGDIALDDVSVYDKSVSICSVPSNVVTAGAGCGNKDVLWTVPGSGSGIGFEIEYGIGLTSPGSGTRVTTTSAPYTLTGLAASSQYCLFIRQICAPGDTSAWSQPVCFTTGNTDRKIPYTEDFETTPIGHARTYDNCWKSTTSTIPAWLVEMATGANTNSSQTGPLYDHTYFGFGSGKYIFLETTGGAQGDTSSLISPWVEVTGAKDPELSFWYHMNGTGMGDLEVWLDLGSGYSLVQTISGQQQAAQGDPWLESVHPIPFGTDSVRVKFRGIRGSAFTSDMALDEIAFYDAAECPPPSALSGNAVGCDSAEISWATNSMGSLVEYGATGFSIGAGTLSSIVHGDSFSVGNLLPGTSYDFYVADTCMGDTSYFVGPLTITTASGPLPNAQIVVISDTLSKGEREVLLYATGGEDYHWDFGNGQTATGDTAYMKYVIDNNHIITLTASNKCGSDTAIYGGPMGISGDGTDPYQIKLYPNPATDLLNISFNATAPVSLTMVDVSGRIVLKRERLETDTEGKTAVDISRLKAGTYIVEIKINEHRAYIKVVVH